MYINRRDIPEGSIEDVIVPYSNIEITHANDNKAPLKVIVKKAVVWVLIVSVAVGLLFF